MAERFENFETKTKINSSNHKLFLRNNWLSLAESKSG